jgi:hypothetical protein
LQTRYFSGHLLYEHLGPKIKNPRTGRSDAGTPFLSLHNNAANPFLGVCIQHETRFRQVFWLTGSAYLLCLPVPIRTVASIKAFIPGYSGGSAPDFHGIPLNLNNKNFNADSNINVFFISKAFYFRGG